MRKNKKVLLSGVVITILIANVLFLCVFIKAEEGVSIADDEIEEAEAENENFEEKIIEEESVNEVVEDEQEASVTEVILEKRSTYELQDHEVIVNDYVALKSAIATANNGKTHIYFGADIIQGNVGIIIAPTKANIIIDGTNPKTGVRHKYTEYKSAATTNSIYLATNPAAPVNVELRNIDVTGENYYGTILIYDVVKNATLTYNNVSYIGPQIAHHRYGTTILKDTTIEVLTSNIHHSQSQEIAEVHILIFEGQNTINHQITAAYPVFNFAFSDGGVLVKTGAAVSIVSNRPFNSGSVTGFNFITEENAEFSFIQEANTGIMLNGGNGTFEVGAGSKVQFIRDIATFHTAMVQWQNVSSKFVIYGQADFIARSDMNGRILNIGAMNIDGGVLNAIAEGNIPSYVVYTTIGQTITDGELNLHVKGIALAEQNGLYQSGVMNAVNSKISLIGESTLGSRMIKMETANFYHSDLSVYAKGLIHQVATGIAFDVTSLKLDNSNVDLRFDYESGTISELGMLIMTNQSKFNTYSKKTVAATGVVIRSAFTLEPTSEMNIIYDSFKNTAFNSSLLQVNGTFMAEENSVLHLIMREGASSSLLYIAVSAGEFKVKNPKSLLLYTRSLSTKVVTGVGTSPRYSINAQQINTWIDPLTFESNGSLDTTPLYQFHKKNYASDYIISGVNAASNTTVTSTNYEPEDGANPSGNFSLLSAQTRVLSIGRLELRGRNPEIGATSLSGVTDPEAEVRFDYIGQGAALEERGFAGGDGNFTFTLTPLSSRDYTFKANKEYLYFIGPEMMLLEGGELRFVRVPSLLDFGIVLIPSQKTMVNRINENWQIEIEDTRPSGANWELLVSMTRPLTPSDKTKPALEDALVFVGEDGKPEALSENPIVVGKSENGSMFSTVSWNNDKGILLQLFPGRIYTNMQYQGTIKWTLQDAP